VFGIARTERTGSALAGLALLAAVFVAFPPSQTKASAQSDNGTAAASASNGICPASSLVQSAFIPPTRPDPEAGYPLWWVKGGAGTGTDHFGLMVEADFPYATWNSWTTYQVAGTIPPVDVLASGAIVPDAGSTNPYVPGNPVMTAQRRFRILVVPQGTVGTRLPDGATIAPRLQGIRNRIQRNTDAPWILAERVFAPFGGYDRIGRGGPTHTPPPTATAVDLTTGAAVSCTAVSALPDSLVRAPGDLGQVDNAFPVKFALANTDLFQRFSLRQTYPPKPHRELVEFFRPSFAAVPVADVQPTFPSTDRCPNYLAAKLQPDQIAMIRIPKMPTFFDASKVSPDTKYPAPDVDFVSLNNYGFDLGLQLPDFADEMNMGKSQGHFKQDSAGGMTLVVWPRLGIASLPPSVALIAAKARANGWNLERGNIDGPYFGNSEILRYKGTNPNYRYSFAPNNATHGVPCFYNNPANADVAFEDVPAQFAAQPRDAGPATPQGVQCSLTEYLSDTCLNRLKKHIADTGGSYFAS
jgi:hypothetical protein